MNGVFYITVKSHLIRFATVQLEFDKLFANLEANTITSSIAKTDSRLAVFVVLSLTIGDT